MNHYLDVSNKAKITIAIRRNNKLLVPGKIQSIGKQIKNTVTRLHIPYKLFPTFLTINFCYKISDLFTKFIKGNLYL